MAITSAEMGNWSLHWLRNPQGATWMAIITPLLLLLKNYKSLKHVLTPGLIASTILSLLFLIFRKFPPVCSRLPSEERDGSGCQFQWREAEMYMCLMCVLMIKNRTAVSIHEMIDRFLTYSKVVNTVLFFRVDPRLGFVYVLMCFMRIWIFPDVFYDEDDQVLQVDDDTIKDVLRKDTRIIWVIEFYTTWATTCHSVAPVFSSLANRYSNEYLKFAKIDVNKSPKIAKEYGINTTTMSRQLPTLIIFKDTKAVTWRPMAGTNGKLVKYSFTEENIIRDFCLEELHEEAKKKVEKYNNKKKIC